MQYWLMKSEPSCYSIHDLRVERVASWDGVRNYQVRNFFRDQMQVGDLAVFYHSNAGADTGAVGEMEIASEAYADPTQFDPTSDHPDPDSDPASPRWLCVDVRFRSTFAQVVTLPIMRNDCVLSDLPVLRRGNRLSVVPITKRHFSHIRTLGNQT